MPQVDTRGHAHDQYSSQTHNANDTTSMQQSQLSYVHKTLPRRRPRGNTFGMPGPDMGNMPASTDISRSLRFHITSERQGDEQARHDHDRRFSHTNRGDSEAGSINEDHTFGVNMPQLNGRRSRTDSYASTTSSYSYNYTDTSRMFGGDGTGIGEMPVHHSITHGPMKQRDRSSTHTAGTMDPTGSVYEETTGDKDRVSTLVTSTTLGVMDDRMIGEPRESVASFLTFGLSGSVRHPSVISGEGGSVIGVDSPAVKASSTSVGPSTSVDLRPGVSPSPTSLSHSTSHDTIKQSRFFSRQKYSPRPSLESFRSDLSGFGISTHKPGSDDHPNSSGFQPDGVNASTSPLSKDTSVGGAGPSSVSAPTATHHIHNNRVLTHSSVPVLPHHVSSSQLRSRPVAAHVICHADSLEKLNIKRRSTVSSMGPTSVANDIPSTLHFSGISNATRIGVGGAITPSTLVKRPKSVTKNGMFRLAIGVLQQDRWDKEREEERGRSNEKGKEKEYSLHISQQSKDADLRGRPGHPSEFSHYQANEQLLTIPSEASSVVSPNGSVFIESFHSPTDGTFSSNPMHDTLGGSSGVPSSSMYATYTTGFISHAPLPSRSVDIPYASPPAATSAPSSRCSVNRPRDCRHGYILDDGANNKENDGMSLNRRGDSDDMDMDKTDDDDRDGAVVVPKTNPTPWKRLTSFKSTVRAGQEGAIPPLGRNEDIDEISSFVQDSSHTNGAETNGTKLSERIRGGSIVSDGRIRNAIEPLFNPTTNVHSSGTAFSNARSIINTQPNHSTDNVTSNFLNFSFPSPLLSFNSATASSPTTPATTSSTRRLLHSFSQPSLRSLVQGSPPLPRSNLKKAHPPSFLPGVSASSQLRFQPERHPYAMYSSTNYPSTSASEHHYDGATTRMHVGTKFDPNPSVLLDVSGSNGSAPHPYSHAYQESIQTQDTNNPDAHRLTSPVDPLDSHRRKATSTTANIGSFTSLDGQDARSQVTTPHMFRRTLRSSFKLSGSSRPSSTASPNAEMLHVPATTPANAGGSLRSSIRASVSTPNLRSLFKFGHLHENKPHDREGTEAVYDNSRSATVKGKKSALPTSTTSVPKQPTTPKKTKHPKTQYSAETWCDALLFPRPRFRAHVTSPPASPIHISALNTANSQSNAYTQVQSSPGPDWDIPTNTTSSGPATELVANVANVSPANLPRTPPRESHFTTDSPPLISKPIPPPPKLKAPPKGKIRRGNGVTVPPLPSSSNPDANLGDVEPHSMLSTLEQVLIEGEIREREREHWNEIAKSSFQNRRSRSLSRSRKRAGTTSTATSAEPSSEHARGRGRNLSDAGRKSEERTHRTASSISRSLAAGLTTLAAGAFRQPTPTISTVSHHGQGAEDSHQQTATMTTESHSHGHHSRTTSESCPTNQRHNHSHVRNTSWGKAAFRTLCGSASEDEDGRPSEDDGTVSSRGRRGGLRITGKNEAQQHHKVVDTGYYREGTTGPKVKSADKPAIDPVVPAAERSLSPNSNASEPAEIVIALSTPPPQSSTPNDSVIEFPDLSGHPYAQSRAFPASAPYAGPYPSSRNYKPLYTPRHNVDYHRSHSDRTKLSTKPVTASNVFSVLQSAEQRDDMDSWLSTGKKADPTPYAYANTTESNKRESTLGVEEALLSSPSFRRFVDAILEDDRSGDIDVEARTPKHSPRNLEDAEERPSFYPVLREVPTLSNVTSAPPVYPEVQYIQHPPVDPNTSLSSPSSQNSSYSRMSRPLGAVDDLEQFRDLFFHPVNSPVANDAVESNDNPGSNSLSPTASSSKFLGSSDFPWSAQKPFPNDAQVQSPSFDASLRFTSTNPVDHHFILKQDFPEDIESSRASSVIEHDFMEDNLRLGTVPPSVPVMTESGEQRQSTTLSFIDNTRNRDTILSTASAYSLPSVGGHHDNEVRQSFITNASSSTSGVAKLLGDFPAPPPPSKIGEMASGSRPDSYHVLGLAESQHITSALSKT